MKPRTRKVLSAVGLVAGLVLVFFEVRRSAALGRVDSWFWLLVGALVIVFAAAEFLPGRRAEHGADSTGNDGRR